MITNKTRPLSFIQTNNTSSTSTKNQTDTSTFFTVENQGNLNDQDSKKFDLCFKNFLEKIFFSGKDEKKPNPNLNKMYLNLKEKSILQNLKEQFPHLQFNELALPQKENPAFVRLLDILRQFPTDSLEFIKFEKKYNFYNELFNINNLNDEENYAISNSLKNNLSTIISNEIFTLLFISVAIHENNNQDQDKHFENLKNSYIENMVQFFEHYYNDFYKTKKFEKLDSKQKHIVRNFVSKNIESNINLIQNDIELVEKMKNLILKNLFVSNYINNGFQSSIFHKFKKELNFKFLYNFILLQNFKGENFKTPIDAIIFYTKWFKSKSRDFMTKIEQDFFKEYNDKFRLRSFDFKPSFRVSKKSNLISYNKKSKNVFEARQESWRDAKYLFLIVFWYIIHNYTTLKYNRDRNLKIELSFILAIIACTFQFLGPYIILRKNFGLVELLNIQLFGKYDRKQVAEFEQTIEDFYFSEFKNSPITKINYKNMKGIQKESLFFTMVQFYLIHIQKQMVVKSINFNNNEGTKPNKEKAIQTIKNDTEESLSKFMSFTFEFIPQYQCENLKKYYKNSFEKNNCTPENSFQIENFKQKNTNTNFKTEKLKFDDYIILFGDYNSSLFLLQFKSYQKEKLQNKIRNKLTPFDFIQDFENLKFNSLIAPTGQYGGLKKMTGNHAIDYELKPYATNEFRLGIMETKNTFILEDFNGNKKEVPILVVSHYSLKHGSWKSI